MLELMEFLCLTVNFNNFINNRTRTQPPLADHKISNVSLLFVSLLSRAPL